LRAGNNHRCHEYVEWFAYRLALRSTQAGVPVFDQRLLVNLKEKRENALVAEGGSHSIIQFEDLNFRYGNGSRVLTDMTFVLNPGSIHFLTRPRRTEKTLLLRFMYHLTMRQNRSPGWNLWPG
jgi:ATPase subunit of ABC transporter with duplicated ATPase domains